MFVKLILPALLEAKDPGFRPIKYALFPPLGLAALAGYLDDEDQVVLEDEHVMSLTTDDRPDLAVMSVYITSASGSPGPETASGTTGGRARPGQQPGGHDQDPSDQPKRGSQVQRGLLGSSKWPGRMRAAQVVL